MTTSSSKRNIWITGASGFLGSRLVRYFSLTNNDVVGLSRRNSPAPKSVTVDLASRGCIDVLKQLSAPDIVIHAASQQPGAGNLHDFIASNVQATSNLVEALSKRPPHQLIYTSTLSVYHGVLTLPVTEEAPAGGRLPYSSTKRWAEQLLESLKSSTDVIVLRLPSLFGKGQADSFIDGLARNALRNEPIELFAKGQVIRDALHVTDVVQTIGAGVQRSRPPGYAIMNLGCGRAIKTIEYAESLVEALGSSSEIVLSDRPASHHDLYADIRFAQQEIGFVPRTLSQSMRDYANELRT